MANQYNQMSPQSIASHQDWLKKKQGTFDPATKMGLKEISEACPERETPFAYSEWIQSIIHIDADTADVLGIAIDMHFNLKKTSNQRI